MALLVAGVAATRASPRNTGCKSAARCRTAGRRPAGAAAGRLTRRRHRGSVVAEVIGRPEHSRAPTRTGVRTLETRMPGMTARLALVILLGVAASAGAQSP